MVVVDSFNFSSKMAVEIPYVLHSSLDGVFKTHVKDAMNVIEYFSMFEIDFQEKEEDDLECLLIKYQNKEGCFYGHCNSSLSLSTSGRPTVVLSDDCKYFGSVLHEMLHAVGFVHEHQRPGVKDFIIINEDNIDKDSDWKDQLLELSCEGYELFKIDNAQLPFDPDSIMMYGHYPYSNDSTKKTLEVEDGTDLIHASKKNCLSEGDKEKLGFLGSKPYELLKKRR